MSTEQNAAEPVGYWWCQNCKEEVGSYHVTYQEKHESCGHTVEWIDPVESVSELTALREKLAERDARIAEISKKYDELIMAVAKKFPNESRHETALKYIVQRESGNAPNCGTAAKAITSAEVPK